MVHSSTDSVGCPLPLVIAGATGSLPPPCGACCWRCCCSQDSHTSAPFREPSKSHPVRITACTPAHAALSSCRVIATITTSILSEKINQALECLVIHHKQSVTTQSTHTQKQRQIVCGLAVAVPTLQVRADVHQAQHRTRTCLTRVRAGPHSKLPQRYPLSRL